MSHSIGGGPGGELGPGPGGSPTDTGTPGSTTSPSQSEDLSFPFQTFDQFVTFTGDSDGFFTPNPIFIIPSYDGTITPFSDTDGTITPIGCC